MPSKKHERIKKMLQTASNRMKRKGRIPIFKHMRPVLELSTIFSMLPWGVHFKKVVLENKSCFRKVVAEVIIPSKAVNTYQIILYMHGGGYTIGSLHTHRALVGRLAKKTNRVGIIIEYRKAPENPFPAAVNDAVISYKALLERGKKPKDIIFVGDSAGGGLVIATQLALKEQKIPLPGAGVCISPWVDLTVSNKSIEKNKNNDPLVDKEKMQLWSKMYSGKYPVTHPQISPVFADLKGLSPLLIQVSNAEMLYDDSLNIVKKAEEDGVEVNLQVFDGLIHWWHLFQKTVPEAKDAIDKIAVFINNIFSTS